MAQYYCMAHLQSTLLSQANGLVCLVLYGIPCELSNACHLLYLYPLLLVQPASRSTSDKSFIQFFELTACTQLRSLATWYSDDSVNNLKISAHKLKLIVYRRSGSSVVGGYFRDVELPFVSAVVIHSSKTLPQRCGKLKTIVRNIKHYL